jgi:AraC-like DNA-binding protein
VAQNNDRSASTKNFSMHSHSFTHTSDVDEARDAVRDVYLPHDLSVRGDFDMTLNAYGGDSSTLGFLAYGADTRLHMPPTGSHYHVNLTIQGHTEGARADGARSTTEANRSGLVLPPDQDTRVHWSADAEQLIFRFSRQKLENFAQDLTGVTMENPLDFDFGIDLTTPRGASLLASARFMALELDRPGGIAENPLVLEQLETFVMSNLLTTVPSRLTPVLETPAPTVKLGRLRPVVDFMQANADEPLTPDVLARAGCMSVRTLHASFRQVLGTTPMEYLRRIRMERVRIDLINARDTGERITEIANRWGFYHPSRFAAQYRDAYGELPSETLNRAS